MATETCCFGLNLKIGNIILGCVNASCSFLLFIIMLMGVCTAPPYIQPAEEVKYPIKEAELPGLRKFFIILVIMFLAKFLFDVLFIYGIVKERAGLIRSYFVMWALFFLIAMVMFFLCAPHSFMAVCFDTFYTCLNLYMILLSCCYYKIII